MFYEGVLRRLKMYAVFMELTGELSTLIKLKKKYPLSNFNSTNIWPKV